MPRNRLIIESPDKNSRLPNWTTEFLKKRGRENVSEGIVHLANARSAQPTPEGIHPAPRNFSLKIELRVRSKPKTSTSNHPTDLVKG